MSNTKFPDATALERSRALGLEHGQAHAGGSVRPSGDELAFPDTATQATLNEWAGHDAAAFGILLEAAMAGYREALGEAAAKS